MSAVPVLYHAETSFYSQRARLAFAEKGVKYKSYLINLIAAEVHEPWFMRQVNPKGQVPAMEHLGQYYTDSKDVIEYVDTLPSDKPKLCPDDGSERAAKIRYYQEKLESVDVPAISFGSLYHRHLTVNCMVPSFLGQDKLKGKITGAAKRLERLQEENPDLVEGLNQRKGHSELSDVVFDEKKFLAVVDGIDKIFNEIEDELQKQKAEYGDTEYWLCGQTFTIADIYLSCLLHRLTFVGQAQRLFLAKRPLVTDYYKRVLLRKTFRKECVYANSLFWGACMPMLRASLKKARPFIFGMTAVAVGVIAYYKKEEIIDLGNEMYAKLKSHLPTN